MSKKNFKIPDNELKLIYVLKVGLNSKGETIYEFLFSRDEEDIDAEEWGWTSVPASEHAQPPNLKRVDEIISLKTSSINLFCLHEADDREYMHGYYTIHAIAYESQKNSDGYQDYDKQFGDENENILVFHYGHTLERIKKMFSERSIILKNNEFVEIEDINFDE